MKNELLVSVIVCKKLPFSEENLTLCLESVKHQVYRNLEIIFVCDHIPDQIIKTAEQKDCKIVRTGRNLLGARYAGLEASKGEWILFLDTNQILEKTAIQRAIEKVNGLDMLCLEQKVYEPLTWIQRLYNADRKLINRSGISDFQPPALAQKGASMATFYRKALVARLFKNIYPGILSHATAHDHATIFSEAYKISKKVGLLYNAVFRIEPPGLMEFWQKNYEYRKASRILIEHGYGNLFSTYKKPKLRNGTFNMMNFHLGIQSILLLALKAVAMKIEYGKGKE